MGFRVAGRDLILLKEDLILLQVGLIHLQEILINGFPPLGIEEARLVCETIKSESVSARQSRVDGKGIVKV